jgi:tetratricopeptide (TPR) repeat protein
MSRADRRRDARARPSAAPSRYESAYVGTEGLFFQRLRAQAKWMFVFLALVFAVSFVFFGVGANISGTGVADILGFGGGGTGQPSVDDARERLDNNPTDAQALRDLATALQTEGKTQEAIQPLEQYTALRPKDEDALRELAGLQLVRANNYRDDAVIAQAAALELAPQTDILPPETSELGQALGDQAISDAVSQRANEAFTKAYTRMQGGYNAAKATYVALARLAPGDASIQFQLGDTAQTAGDTATAIAAYKRFVKLAPDDPSAPDVRKQIKALEEQQSTPVATSSGG